MCRTGTTGTSKFFNLFGIKSHHQKLNPGPRHNKKFNFLDPPKWAADYINQKTKAVIDSGIGYESNWELRHYLYGIARACPEVKFIISIRDPQRTVSSLKAYNRKDAKSGDLVKLYSDTYQSLFDQSIYFPNRVFWMSFEDYAKGKYIVPFFNLFGIDPNDDNMVKAQTFLKKKIRSSGEYPLIQSRGFSKCLDATLVIKHIVKELS
jgi:hypothetical protein